MSDDFHRPTLTYPNNIYNATQVRLYGILPDETPGGILYPGQTAQFKQGSGDLEIAVSVEVADRARRSSGNKLGSAVLPEKKKESERAHNKTSESLGLFRELITTRANENPEAALGLYTQVSIEVRKLGKVAFSAMISRESALKTKKVISCGIIVGYSYEGHTYDLAKPKIMVIPALPEPTIPADDSGYKVKEPHHYAVWLVDKLDECAEFELNQGFVEEIILDANLPGKRSPNMYSGKMLMSHRSGRLNE